MSTPADHVVVVGAGCSTLIDDLVDDGFERITAVDISARALDRLRTALGERAGSVDTVVSDVCEFVADEPCAVWHDRATFHFLTTVTQQRAYVDRASATVRSGGHLVLSGFAADGPAQCSGLDVERHSLDDLSALFGADFELVDSTFVEHLTPWATTQRFLHTLFRRR